MNNQRNRVPSREDFQERFSEENLLDKMGRVLDVLHKKEAAKEIGNKYGYDDELIALEKLYPEAVEVDLATRELIHDRYEYYHHWMLPWLGAALSESALRYAFANGGYLSEEIKERIDYLKERTRREVQENYLNNYNRRGFFNYGYH